MATTENGEDEALSKRVRETALVESCKMGDRDAWNKLIARYRKWIFKLAFSLCRNCDEANDITAQVLLRLYLSLHTFRNTTSFSSWLYTIVRNTYIDQCVRRAHRRMISLDAYCAAEDETFSNYYIVAASPSAEALYLKKEASQIIARAIEHLPAYHRQVLRMYHDEGRSYDDISETTGLSVGTVKSRLSRARGILRERLAQYQDVLISA